MALTKEKLSEIKAAVEIVQNDGVIVFPTETVYGLGADASNEAAVRKIYEIKQRPADHPLIVHIGQLSQLVYWAKDVPESAWLLARHFWPGPLTLILKRSRNVPDCVTGGQDTVGIRIPAHPVALALLDAMGENKALAAPSANLYGKISPTSAVHVHTTLNGKVDMILDGGNCTIGLESTIVSLERETVEVLRPGGISVSAIESVLDQPVIWRKNQTSGIRVSGALPSHYAPTTPLKLYAVTEIGPAARKFATQNFRVAAITWSELDASQFDDQNIQHVVMPADPVSYGKRLYAVLHDYDQAGLDYILMESPPEQLSWLAIADRLQRASYSHT